MHSLKAFAFIALFGLLSACSVNPVTGERELSLMSEAQEVGVGEQNYLAYQQQGGGPYEVDPSLNDYVSRVGMKLANAGQRPDLPYEFVVLNSSVPNAWALPGGKIAINRGLLVLLEDEAQLAAVLGHEMVHAAARHTAQKMTQATLLNVGLQATGMVLQSSDYGQWIMSGAGLGANLWQAHYGRDQELEADKYGTQVMAKVGYNPQAAVELQSKLLKLSEGQHSSWFDQMLASHPPSQERMQRNQQYANQHPGGARNEQAFQNATAQLRKDKDAYEAHTQALAAAENKQIDKALQLIQDAIRKQPKEGLFYVTLGQLQMSQKRDSEALKAFTKARELNPKYYVGHLGAGLLLKKDNRSKDAIAALESSVKLLPSTLATYHLGELYLAENQRDKAVAYFQHAAQGEGEIAEAARQQLARLMPAQAG